MPMMPNNVHMNVHAIPDTLIIDAVADAHETAVRSAFEAAFKIDPSLCVPLTAERAYRDWRMHGKGRDLLGGKRYADAERLKKQQEDAVKAADILQAQAELDNAKAAVTRAQAKLDGLCK